MFKTTVKIISIILTGSSSCKVKLFDKFVTVIVVVLLIYFLK